MLSGSVKLCLMLAAVWLCAIPHARAQRSTFPPVPTVERGGPLDKYPRKPSLPPAFSIPVGPLGFTAPGPVYFLRRESLVSLDFLDESRLLFSFHVSGLLPRDAGDKAGGKERQIRAVVVALPDGKIESEARWVIPDRARYLWMLKDGRFLLRNRDGIDQGDASLKLTSYLRFPGELLWLEMDPAQQFLITNSLELATPKQEPGDTPSSAKSPNGPSGVLKAVGQAVLVVRTLQRESGQVMRVSRVPWTAQTNDWPMNSDGYLIRSHDSGERWLLNLKFFAGGGRILGHVDSRCAPKYSFVSEKELLVTVCDPMGGGKLMAMSTNGELLWDGLDASNAIWPLLVMAPNGVRVARETLLLKRPVGRYKRLLRAEDFQGQIVSVFDAVDGREVLKAPVRPMLDGGGNVAISPSGRRVAILSAGAIQVFELPPPAPPGDAGTDQPAH